jgi:hypothetical protein
MSEIPNIQTQNQIETNFEEQSRLEAIRQRASETIGRISLHSQIMVHGIKAKFIEHRSESAENILEKMDHKESLYEHVTLEADEVINDQEYDTLIVHRDENGNPPEIRSYAEKRQSSKIFDRTLQASRDKTTYEKMGGRNKLFYDVDPKPKEKGPPFSPRRQETTSEKLKRTTDFEDGKKGKLVSKLPSEESKYHRKLRSNAIKSERKRIKATRQPGLTAWRIGSEKSRISEITDSSNPDVKVGDKTTVIEGPITSRRGRAVRRIKNYHYAGKHEIAKQHRQRQDELRARLK